MDKKILFIIVISLVFLPLIHAGNYGALRYGVGVYGTGEVPATTPPDGGGGGGGCTYDWHCTNWFPAECPRSGIQERICANKGSCTGTSSMPVQIQTCEYTKPTEPLFDIFLTLSDRYKEICAGNKIKANIRLENYGKIELLDAFMTYWIINQNNTLITELKDTRAVENEKDFNIKIKIPESTAEGTHRLYAQINYDKNKTAVAGESFEIISKENCISYPFSNISKYIYLFIITLLLVLIILIIKKTKFKTFRKKSTKKRKKFKVHKTKKRFNRIKYLKSQVICSKAKEKKTKLLKKLRALQFKTIITTFICISLIGILSMKQTITGFVVGSGETANNLLGIIYFTFITGCLGLLIFLHKKSIKNIIEYKKRNKYAINSLKGLIKKKVYTDNGNYVGKVREIILEENKIHSLKIKLDKKFKGKGIIAKYKAVRNVGHIVIINNKIFENLEKV